MKICEGCIKQDVCKFKENVEKLEKKSMECPEPLVPNMTCKFKEALQQYWKLYTYPTIPSYDDSLAQPYPYPLQSPWIWPRDTWFITD